MTFPVFFGGQTVGEVRVSKTGLYYRFDCSCTPPDSNIYRITLSCNDVEVNLGICVPSGENLGLTKRLPVGNVADNKWVFHLRPKNTKENLKQ